MHSHADFKKAASVVHGIAFAFWASCILGAVLLGLSLVIFSIPIHAAPLDWCLDLINVQKWPVLLQVVFSIGAVAAILDAIHQLTKRKRQ